LREERARPLMQRFDELVRQHVALRELFGLMMTGCFSAMRAPSSAPSGRPDVG
jgi:hypothetical protein